MKERNKREFLTGPLKISADQTISREKGKWIEAEGNVSVQYEMESGDILESFSQYARYDEKKGLGELWGKPNAVWKPRSQGQPPTRIVADKMILRIQESELFAGGNVTVTQASNTLKANEIRFFNAEKKMTASGGRPLFTTYQAQEHIRIHAEKIVTWTEKKKIQFNEQVRGVVEFLP